MSIITANPHRLRAEASPSRDIAHCARSLDSPGMRRLSRERAKCSERTRLTEKQLNEHVCADAKAHRTVRDVIYRRESDRNSRALWTQKCQDGVKHRN